MTSKLEECRKEIEAVLAKYDASISVEDQGRAYMPYEVMVLETYSDGYESITLGREVGE